VCRFCVVFCLLHDSLLKLMDGPQIGTHRPYLVKGYTVSRSRSAGPTGGSGLESLDMGIDHAPQANGVPLAIFRIAELTAPGTDAYNSDNDWQA
jgi:hypothetical protein